MTRRLVCDASALTALLLDAGQDGAWVAAEVAGCSLLAPSLAIYEASNIIRRQERRGAVSPDQAAQAHADLLDLEIEYWPYEPLATVCWQHRANLSIYDASYVALAELTDAALATLDRRLAKAPGLDCAVLTPASSGS